MDDNWVKIYSSQHLYRVEIIKGMLEEKGIKGIIINKKDSSYLFGDAELYVKVEDAFMAKQLITKSDND